MSKLSPLEEYLQAEIGQARKDSSGEFTLGGAQAVQKLAAFQLPRENSWVLKIVQAAVSLNCQRLDIKQTWSDTEFHFDGDLGLSLEEFEHTFLDAQQHPWRGVQHLKHGLWSVSIYRMRPFLICGPNWKHSLIWDGRRLTRQTQQKIAGTLLTVSHRAWQEGKGFPILREIEAAGHNAAVAKELGAVFACPIPCFLDSRRLDGLNECPDHGFSDRNFPILLAFANDPELPTLSLASGTERGYLKGRWHHRTMRQAFQPPAGFPRASGLSCLVASHLRMVQSTSGAYWDSYQQLSRAYWVSDGVVIEQTELPIPALTCSVGLVVSAQGLDTDISGFRLRPCPIYAERLRRAIVLAGSAIQTEHRPQF